MVSSQSCVTVWRDRSCDSSTAGCGTMRPGAMASVLVSLLVLRISSSMVSLIVGAREDSAWRCDSGKNERRASV